jgi:dTDP-4-dehydrorhamnose 3,5-epimerase
MTTNPKKDIQTVTPEGKPTKPLIDGVRVRYAITHPDDRGSLCEIFNPIWGIHEEPLVYVYTATIRPNKIKGWVVHRKQDDRLFVSHGTLRFVLFDDRADSPTHKAVNEIYIGEQNRALIIIPRGVYHALHNVGLTDAVFINMPTRAYDHADPDKYRLPINNDLIPYRFREGSGG